MLAVMSAHTVPHLAAVAFAGAASFAIGFVPSGDEGPVKKTNRLAAEKSPYLLQHATNPVDWYPWGEEAFEKARREEKPVFLSIGYSTCHWCHVMEHESFEDEEVAALLNREFVSIKVDREEREDVDGVYMDVCVALTGRGGWPLTIVMTPDKKPFFAGTYFPKRANFRSSGLMDILENLSHRWKTDRAKLLESAEGHVRAVAESHARATAPDPFAAAPAAADASLLSRARADLGSYYDEEFGGFGSAPKFPSPHNYTFLLAMSRRQSDAAAPRQVDRSLRAMRLGGIFDQVGFGFHRYSTDREWHVPHFEKMLYDQATMTMACVEAHLATGEEFHAAVAREVIAYVERALTSPGGAFYSAEDADSEGEEGRFYLWTRREFEEVLGKEDGALFASLFDVTEEGNYHDEATGRRDGRSIPRLEKPIDDPALRARWDAARRKLFDAREKRVHPHKDDKILTSWNALMISALARASRAFGDERHAATAARAAEFVWRNLRRPSDGRLLRRWRDGEAAFLGCVDDYAFFIQAALDLYEATFDPLWIERALELDAAFVRLFWDEAGGGGYFFDGSDGEKLFARRKEIFDGAVPSGNSVAFLDAIRLERMTGDTRFGARADAIARAFSGAVAKQPSIYAQFLIGLDFLIGPSREIVIAGRRGSDDAKAMLREVNGRYLPRTVVLFRPDGEEGERLARLAPYVAGQTSRDGRATAYVCRDFACGLPTTDVAEFVKSLETK